MATSAQILANRENSQHSTGPRSVPGKARSAANSTKHGLSSAFTVLPNEDPASYQILNDGYLDEFAPATNHETFLVQQMIHARWRILRIQRLEVRLFSNAVGDPQDPNDADSAILRNMAEKGVDVANALHRYAASAERTYYKAHRDLTTGRAAAVATKAAITRTEAAIARRETAEAEKALYAYLDAPIPAPPTAHSDVSKRSQSPAPGPFEPHDLPVPVRTSPDLPI